MAKFASSLKQEAQSAKREARKQEMMEKRQQKQLAIDELNAWYDDMVGGPQDWAEFKAMWEVSEATSLL